ncbi:MOSC-domain-containing protein [Polyplosphaeria fusca]|uniref:MOSC-domain-containing protein n=1 Tax=Polyplosphaeria fusca TaxID=682080 RepID=A0A9P4QRI6_9PLEO|nr:MOSC-domain-containing protein [Polyplosphaeria fusca]
MKISEIYLYPIKSLRGTRVSEALATKHGFQYDRRFMLLKPESDGYKNLLVSGQNEMVFFLTNITLPQNEDQGPGSVQVTYTGPRSCGNKSLTVPLRPADTLEKIDITMHNSPTSAYKMLDEYNAWFSACFGYDVVLAYLGGNRRKVLFEEMQPKPGSWLSTLSSTILGSSGTGGTEITFADCAPFLVVSKTSLDDVSSRLPVGEHMDVTKFRPNIVIEGADEPWEEDFWGQLSIGGVALTCAHNCVRCQSINIDYSTGAQGTGESGKVLKKLQKDRRVDQGAKWSPVFGRYTYWNTKTEQQPLKVGDQVEVIQRNSERTVWSWKGLG